MLVRCLLDQLRSCYLIQNGNTSTGRHVLTPSSSSTRLLSVADITSSLSPCTLSLSPCDLISSVIVEVCYSEEMMSYLGPPTPPTYNSGHCRTTETFSSSHLSPRHAIKRISTNSARNRDTTASSGAGSLLATTGTSNLGTTPAALACSSATG